MEQKSLGHGPKNLVGFSPVASNQLFSQTPQLTIFHPLFRSNLQSTFSQDKAAYTSLFPGRFLNDLACMIHKPGQYLVPFSPETCEIDQSHLGFLSAGCRCKWA